MANGGLKLSELNEKAREGLRRYLECVDEEYTGMLKFDFRNGTPQIVTRPERLGRSNGDAGRS